MELLTLDQLKRKREADLFGSVQAVGAHRDTYLEIKRLVGRINSAPVDVGEYHSTASRLGTMLMEMTHGIDNTIFHYFADNIDPDRSGDVRCFRLECRELADQIRQLDQWRTGRHRLRRIK